MSPVFPALSVAVVASVKKALPVPLVVTMFGVVMVGENSDAELESTTLPVPVTDARSATVTKPVAVKLDVIVGPLIVGDVASTTLPLPVTEARSAAVTSPVAVKLDVTVNPAIDCAAVQLLELPRLSLTVTDPVHGPLPVPPTVIVLSPPALPTDATAAAPPHDPQDGVVFEPLSKHSPAVAVPAKTAKADAVE